MPDLNHGNRPLSPFMLGQYYRFQLNSVTSILTRITGNALLLAACLIVWWFLAAATSEEYYTTVNGVITSWIGDLIMFLSLWGLWFHTLSGLRHLYWDTGRGLDLETSDKLGWGIIGGSAVLTILTAIVI